MKGPNLSGPCRRLLPKRLPISIWRVDNRNAWTQKSANPAGRPIADYFHQNFYITTSGDFRTQSLLTPCWKSAPTVFCGQPGLGLIGAEIF